jgi:hypothetical protein
MRLFRNSLTLSLVALIACVQPHDAPLDEEVLMAPPVEEDYRPVPETSGGETTSFEHPDSIGRSQVTVEEVLTRMTEEGPVEYSSRVHACRKMPYSTLGRVLEGFGVDLQDDGATSAGRLYRRGAQALGAPNYGARISESSDLTTASAAKLFDIMVQAAPDIIANVPSLERCELGGEPSAVFRDDGTCSRNGLSCLLGERATMAHVELCDDTVARADDPDEGRIIAVASMLAAAFTCE